MTSGYKSVEDDDKKDVVIAATITTNERLNRPHKSFRMLDNMNKNYMICIYTFPDTDYKCPSQKRSQNAISPLVCTVKIFTGKREGKYSQEN